MRKVLYRLICLSALLVSLPINAYDFESGGVYYKIDGDNVSVTVGDSKYEGDVVIPEQVTYNGKTYSVTSIGSYAFDDCGLTSIIIPNSVTSIGDCAFIDCWKLTSVSLPNSITSIQDSVFDGCNNLTSINISNSVTSIGSRAFWGCGSLTSITIPNSVLSIGYVAFDRCTSLTTIVSGIETPFAISIYTFSSNTFENAELIVPKGAKSAYKSTEGWSRFANIVESNEGVGYENSSFTVNGINYQINGSGKVEVISADNNLTSVTIPETVSFNGNTYAVTALADRSFEGRSDITYLSIPSTITSIGEYSFINCGSNIDVNISSLSAWCKIDFGNEHASPLSSARAFYLNGEEVKDLTIPYGTVTVPRFAFYQCRSIESVSIPGSVKTIDSSAFEDCSGVTSVSLVDGLTLIGGSAFEGCRGLSSVTIPSSVTLIGINAFKNCSGLTNVTSEIQNPFDISDSVFEGISSDATLTVPGGTKSAYQSTAGWKNFANIVDNGGSEIVETKRTIHVATAGTLPELISEEEKYQIEELTLTGYLNGTDFKYIQEMAGDTIVKSYARTSNYTSTDKGMSSSEVINHSYTERPWKVVNHLTTNGKLKKIDLAKADIVGTWILAYDGDDRGYWDTYPGENYIPRGLFNNTHLEEIIIPNSVTSIAPGAFRIATLSSIKVGDKNTVYDSRNDCNGIIETSSNTLIFGFEKTIIPNSVTSISSAFSECSGLTSITIPNSVTSIGSNAFSGCSGLTSINIPNSVTSIGSYAFNKCSSLTSITIPNSVESIGYNAFSGCSGLTSITIPNSVESIENSAFYSCSGLTSITIPNSVVSIGENAFYGCSGLTSVTIPNSDVSIGYRAFYGCSNLESINIPNSVTSIGSEAFNETAWYQDQPEGLVYFGIVAYNYKGDMPEDTSLSIKEGTLGIAGSAFYGCKNLSAIIIPNSVTEIGSSAFWGCSNLSSIVLSNSIKSIRSYVFRECTALTSVTLPTNLESIGVCAFWGCTGLTSMTLPKSLASIEQFAFYNCTNLISIITKTGNPFEIDKSVFDSGDTFSSDNFIYLNAHLSVPIGTKSLYQNTKGWDLFVNISEADTDEVEFTLGGLTYQGSKSDNSTMVKSVDPNMTSLEIPASVSYDGTSYQVTGIDDHAFDGCKMAALVWNAEFALPSKVISNAGIGSNFLLYVQSESYAPSSVKNVVVNNSASSITLSDDGGPFYCPQAFTADMISYTHYYTMETGGDGMGWETIALPFDVQKINHSRRGDIVPFASYSNGSSQKPFWLASMSSNGFKRASSIKANTPYIIAMPNSSNYQNDYNLSGDVTFSSADAYITKTPTFSGTFVPAYTTVEKSSNVFALNVNNRYVTYSGNYDPGSRFISNLRDVRPFEAYISSSSSTRGVIEIDFDDDKTGLNNILFSTDENSEVTIYTISGRKVGTSLNGRLDETIEQLPKGVYIVNGRKIVK